MSVRDEALEEALGIDSRRRIYERVLAFPGSHLREIQRALGLPMGVLNHHLAYLEEHGILTSRMDRYYKRYYPSSMGSREKTFLSAMRQQKPRSLVLHILLHPGATHREILESFDLSPSTLSFYLKGLVEKGVMERTKVGRESTFRVAAEDDVVRVLITYRPSFLDVLVDRFLEVWFEKRK